MSSLDNYLKGAEPVKTCRTCALNINDDLREFFRRKAEGNTHVSFNRFFLDYMKPALKYPYGKTAAERHVKDCLRLDVATGASLD